MGETTKPDWNATVVLSCSWKKITLEPVGAGEGIAGAMVVNVNAPEAEAPTVLAG
jgi:hypothetical protein